MQTLKENITSFSLSINEIDNFIDIELLTESTLEIRESNDSFLSSIQTNMRLIESLIKNIYEDIKNKNTDNIKNNISKCEHIINLVEILIDTPERPNCLLFQDSLKRAKLCIYLLKQKINDINVSSKSAIILPNIISKKNDFRNKNNICLSPSKIIRANTFNNKKSYLITHETDSVHAYDHVYSSDST